MKYFLRQNPGLKLGEDVVGLASARHVANYIANNPGVVDTALVFDVVVNGTSEPWHPTYELWYNETLRDLYNDPVTGEQWRGSNSARYLLGLDGHYLGVQAAAERAILSAERGADADYKAWIQTFPEGKFNSSTRAGSEEEADLADSDSDSNGTSSSAVPSLAAGALVFGLTVNALFVINILVDEKTRKLLANMRTMGLSEAAHWLSWFLTFAVLCGANALLGAAAGACSTLRVLSRTDMEVHFILLMLSGWSFTALMIFLASMISRTQFLNMAGFVLFVGSFLYVVMASTTSDVAAYFDMGVAHVPLMDERRHFDVMAPVGLQVYKPGQSPVVQAIMFLMPWFHFERCFNTILNHVGWEGDDFGGRRFVWSDIYHEPNYGDWSAPSLAFSLNMLLASSAVYLLGAWYAGQVLCGEHGAAQPVYFPLLPAYWGLVDPENTALEGDTIAREQQLSEEDGIESYPKGGTALKELTVQMQRGSLFALLGHNGAGKSTLIKLLTGNADPTHGEAFVVVHPHSRCTLSTCVVCLVSAVPRPFSCSSLRACLAQAAAAFRWPGCGPGLEDLLWGELTAAEHLHLYGRLKGVPWGAVPAAVHKALQAVGLEQHQHGLAGTFSGGMKRRLSMAMASLADPDVIFLDEPTTGLDPLSRRRVWEMIQQLKQERVVVLTTHSMEEADALGDQIAILHTAQLRAVGTSISLKARYGKGYQVTLLSEEGDMEEVHRGVGHVLPGAELISASAGASTFGLPTRNMRYLPRLFTALASSSAESGSADRPTGFPAHLIKEWAISNSTLEEVFMRLVTQFKGVNQTPLEAANSVHVLLCEPAAGGEEEGALCLRMAELSRDELLALPPSHDITLYSETQVPVHVSEVVLHGACPSCIGGGDQALEVEDTPEVVQETLNAQAEPALERRAGADGLVDDTLLAEVSAAAPETTSGAALASASVHAVTWGTQAQAVFLKCLITQRKQHRTNCCAIVLFVVASLLSLLFGLLLHVSGSEEGGCVRGSVCDKASFVRRQLDPQRRRTFDDEVKYAWDLPAQFQLDSTSYNRTVWYSGPPPGHTPLDDYDLFSSGTRGRTFSPYFPDHTVGMQYKHRASPVSEVALRSQELIAGQQQVLPQQCTTLEGHDPYETHQAGDSRSSDGYWTGADPAEVQAWLSDHLVDFGVDVAVSHPAEMALHYTMFAYSAGEQDGGGGGSIRYPCTTLFSPLEGNQTCNRTGAAEHKRGAPYPLASDAMRMMLNAFSSALMCTWHANTSACAASSVPMRVALVAMPGVYEAADAANGSIDFLAALLETVSLLFATMLLLPAYTATVVMEREEKLVHMMEVEGLMPTAYVGATYFFFLVWFLLQALAFVSIQYAAGVHLYTSASPVLLLVLLLVWGHTQAGLAFALAPLFRRARIAYVALVTLTCAVLGVTFALDFIAGAHGSWPPPVLLVPPLAFARATFLILFLGAGPSYQSSELATALGLMFGMGTVLLALGLLFHMGLSTYGRSLLTRQWRRLAARVRAGTGGRVSIGDSMGLFVPLVDAEEGVEAVLGDEEEGSAGRGEEQDPEVAAEQVAAAAALGVQQDTGHPGEFSVVLSAVHKVFPGQGGKCGANHAVQGLHLRVRYGEVFGLLGPNGAGKTTTMAMLCGLESATQGTATVGGLDTAQDMGRINRILGVCPQLDVVWPELTVQEHLYFYARLKGVEWRQQVVAVQRVAASMELDGDCFKRNAGTLSGGQKRRLSIAVALIGEPAILFLDEPTTGLDPDTRQHIWSMIKAQQCAGRSIMLTTHSMEEADTLCSRIGIMTRGRLRCLGTQMHLKNRYGDGLKITVHFAPHIQDIEGTVRREVHHGAKVVNLFQGKCTLMVPRQGLDVAGIFMLMEAKKKRGEVVEWGITQTSLEEVFIKIAQDAERDTT
ncbi:hypothetical protein CYMTET_24039 [Cymbomonas tetramitiformis]|uniref:ABC transporter domain-containing protein n=1 Tax=Cymbomonas tetramitiformis TaxID=36881 RepID=A0AAE0FWW5_9CHLO|nr:hypothetical protein CYMTET_24039 [Cymbomonas tetramitiformis]